MRYSCSKGTAVLWGPSLRRSRLSTILGLALVAGVLVLAAPRTADAQYYSATVTFDEPYQPLPIPGGEPATTIGSATFRGWGYTPYEYALDLPFSVNFYGESYDRINLQGRGLITLGDYYPSTESDTSSVRDPKTRPIPGSQPPHNFVAMWWDRTVCNNTSSGYGRMDNVKTQVVGRAPNRWFVVEYGGCRKYNPGNGQMEAQVWLSEGSDEIIIHYGEIEGEWDAAMGVENLDGSDGTFVPSGATGLDCGGNCKPADVPPGMKVVFSSGANLVVESLRGGDEGFAGVAFPLSFDLRNSGSKPADDFTLQYWVSPEPRLTYQSISMGYDARVWSLEPREAVTVHAEPRLPIELEAGEFYVIVEADPHHTVELGNRSSAFGVFGPFTIGIRAANLTVPWVNVPDLAAPGDTIRVRWLAENSGNLDAEAIPFRVAIESGPYLSPSSRTLATGVVERLEMKGESLVETQITLPEELATGIYHIGVEINPHGTVFEHERRDNVGISVPLVVSQEELVVLTETLPTGHIYGSYEFRLVAAGGDGIHRWTLKEGSSLPPGLLLDERQGSTGGLATFLTGVPGAVGIFPFTVEVFSGGLRVEKTYELEISNAEHELSIVNQVLAQGSFGFDYHDELVAIGGVPPYAWEVTQEERLPHGLFLRSDGVLSGRPLEDGSFEIPVRVTDSQGRQGTKTLVIDVAPPARLTCVTQELPPLVIDEYVEFKLLAAGGKKRPDGSYLWSSGGLIRLAEEVGEESGEVKEDLGLRLDPSGTVTEAPKLFGTFLWTVEVRDDTVGAAPISCPIIVRVPRDRGLTVVTQKLHTAVVGRSYQAQLEASGGQGTLRWSEYGNGRVLDELGLEIRNGTLAGTPQATALSGEEAREFTITLRVEDERGRIGIGVVNLELRATPKATGSSGASKDDGGNCQAAGGAPAAWLIAVLGLALLRRRR